MRREYRQLMKRRLGVATWPSRLAATIALLALALAASAAARADGSADSVAFPGRNGEIVFSSVRSASGPNRFYDLYLMRSNGTRLRRITKGAAFERYPSWSPDGRWIAFISNRSRPGNEGAYEIYVMRPNGSGFRRVTNDRWVDDQLAWSPDGKRLVFSSSRASGRFGLSVINVNGTGYHRLTRDGEGLPAWSPDGRSIAYERPNHTAGVNGIQEIWLMSPDGSNRRQLTFPPKHPEIASLNGHDSMADWSPSGDAIAFARRHRGRQDIYVLRADGTGLRRLTKAAGQHTWPAWSPDGKRIVFVSHRSRKAGIYTMNADGSHERRLITGAVDYAYPDWQPLR
jgi:TolB protein